MCAKGRNQSPIDLVAHLSPELPELIFEYTKPGTLAEINTGHAIQEVVNPGNFIVFTDERYELKQFHFHSPSEHLVNGEAFPMELHFVHQDGAGNYAVVGLLFQEGETNELLNQLPSFKAERGEDPRGDLVDFNELITDREDYFLYNGSLTTPPLHGGSAVDRSQAACHRFTGADPALPRPPGLRQQSPHPAPQLEARPGLS